VSVEEIVHFLSGPFFLPTVPFLNTSDEFLSVAADLIEIIVGQLTPPGFDFAFQLMPLPFQHILIHSRLLYDRASAEQADQEQHDGDHEQHVNECANRVGANHAKQPGDQQDYG
jgi:hypothetical protein